ncbi:sugar transferase [Palleronia sp. LCG004]|uniref:sugar transferase n=1 Tax=Palleronia sp. LCG004 TaxID=3079304 RepID=UPI002942F775|nr:sugar transferase [Palleronia sp. LCG004]WOI58419.1 sugar transferase [Palleronia sp. LCG004]
MSKPDYLIEFSPEHAAAVSVGNVSPVAIRKERGAGVYLRAGKRGLDLLLTLLFVPIVLPTILILALLIARDGASPFYIQKRVGLNGRIFGMWKLRTMVPDAEARLDAYLASSEEVRSEWEIKQKLRHDPRITRFGRILRRTSLDELPQFFNVLRGDMSIVGPRPMMAGQEHLYPGLSYYALRPGLTGPWQVSDRNASSFADRARFDDAYFREISVSKDIRLMASTVDVVLRGTGC